MIYIVEDDAGIRDMMIYTLKATGLSAAGFEDSASFGRPSARSSRSSLCST